MAIVSRTANLQVTRAFIASFQNQQLSLEASREQITTGRKVNDPSDDSGRSGTIAALQETLRRLELYKDRMNIADNLLAQQEGIMNSAEQILVRARELATQGANETLGVDQRATLATEVFELRDAFVTLANTRLQGRYIYGGADDDDPPFDATTYTNPADPNDPASVRYIFDNEAGTALTRSVQVNDSSAVRVTTSGDDVFTNGIIALERLGRALSGYRTTPEDLSGPPDGGGVPFVFPTEFEEQTADILEALDLVEAARANDLAIEKASIGSRGARIEEARSINDTMLLNVEQSRSTYQDVDIVEAVSDFQTLQVSLEATLATGATINRLSLLDFL